MINKLRLWFIDYRIKVNLQDIRELKAALVEHPQWLSEYDVENINDDIRQARTNIERLRAKRVKLGELAY
ncbi:MAG: hypothetical protein R3309_04185 [Reinekea sp.]|nr:hypothetical protein [Reinekea sp.]